MAFLTFNYRWDILYRECNFINSALSDQTDVSGAKRLKCNIEPQRVFQGQVPGHRAFVLSTSEARRFIAEHPRNKEVIYPFLIGRDVVTGAGQPTRCVIDFQGRDVNDASVYIGPFKRIRESVLPDRQQKADEGKANDGTRRPHHQLFLRYWWRHSYDRPDMISLIESVPRYIVCSRVTKRPIFTFVSSCIRPDGALMVFVFPDDYSFGILQSNLHWLWFITKCSKLTERYRYTPPSVFDTFPWPQDPKDDHIDAVAEAGREVRRIRSAAIERTKGGLRGVYRLLELPGANPLKDAHVALDQAVLNAYGFSARNDLLTQLLELNLEVAKRIRSGARVVAPGVPDSYPFPATLVTDDCIGADALA